MGALPISDRLTKQRQREEHGALAPEDVREAAWGYEYLHVSARNWGATDRTAG